MNTEENLLKLAKERGWNYLYNIKLPLNFVKKYIDKFRDHGSEIIMYNPDIIKNITDLECAILFESEVDFGPTSCLPDVPIDVLLYFSNRINWSAVSRHHYLTDELFNKCYNYLKYDIIASRSDCYEFKEYILGGLDRSSSANVVIDDDSPLYDEIINKYHDVVNWNNISIDKLSLETINKYKNQINWDNIDYNNLSISLVEEYSDKINWDNIDYNNISTQIIENYSDKINWDLLANAYSRLKIDAKFVIKYKDKFTDEFIVTQLRKNNYNDSDILDIITEDSDTININYLLHDMKFNAMILVNKYPTKINWDEISKEDLSKRFVKKFDHKINWRIRSRYEILTIKEIRDHEDQIDWDSENILHRRVRFKFTSKSYNFDYQFIKDYIGSRLDPDLLVKRCKNIPEKILRDFIEYFDLNLIIKYQKPSIIFLEDYKDKLNWNQVKKLYKNDSVFLIRYGIKNEYKSMQYKQNKVLEAVKEHGWDYVSDQNKFNLTEQLLEINFENVNWDIYSQTVTGNKLSVMVNVFYKYINWDIIEERGIATKRVKERYMSKKDDIR